MADSSGKIYQLKIHVIDVSPMVWRRLLVRDDTSIAQLHGILQLVMGWENSHLHCFVIYGKEYGVVTEVGWAASNLKKMEKRIANTDYEKVDFYLAKRDL